MNDKYCIVIPHYNHHHELATMLPDLALTQMAVIVVDDGSAHEARAALAAFATSRTWLSVEWLPENRGKGAAVMLGLRSAGQRGFTHAVQIDADGQHAVADMPALIAASVRHPDAVIAGDPQMGDDIPWIRLYGRKFTQLWVWLETLSTTIKDAMCGYRVYPIARMLALSEETPLGPRMQFDIEILVRCVWLGLAVHFVPCRVRYDTGGRSHFRMVRDNIDITLMHTRLVFGMLTRAPGLLRRHACDHELGTP